MIIQPYNFNLAGRLQSNLVTSPIHAQMSSHVASNTLAFNTDFNQKYNHINMLSERGVMRTQQRLMSNPNYRGGRGIGVKNAWRYEQFDMEMGGSGSGGSWMFTKKDEIVTTGKAKGAEGHHAQNVADHPLEQSNPDNIIFFKDRKDHLQKGHGGDFHNESDMPMIDRKRMVRNTNTKRIIKNEIKGVGIAAIIGFGTTATMSYIIELSKNGISYETFKNASRTAAINGTIGAGFGIGSYLVYRGVELVADYAIKKMGIQLSEGALKGIKGGVAGGILIAGTSAYGYWQLRNEGYSVQDSLIETGIQSIFPTVTLALSLYGGPIGLTIGTVSTLGYMGYSLFMDNKIAKELILLQLELLYLRALKK